jgi:hypothetical protein
MIHVWLTLPNCFCCCNTGATRRSQAEKHFRDAVMRRGHYDTTWKEYERTMELQNTRIRTEDITMTSMQAAVLVGQGKAGAGAHRYARRLWGGMYLHGVNVVVT